MELWANFTDLLVQAIGFLTTEVGVSQGVAIILLTLIVRLLLSPLSSSAIINSYKNRKAIAAIKPELDKLKSVYKNKPNEMAKQTMALYQKHDIKFVSKTLVANISSQAIFGFGMYQVLQKVIFSSKFAWISNIAKPDILLAMLVGALTYVSMIMMPGSAEQASAMFLLIPTMVSVAVLISAPSALGLYWATSSAFTALQSVVMQKYFEKQQCNLTQTQG
ncbi:membrane protein insertase YidC [uncultured Shewanella sp.]|uniref:YidC/Oxa1 family membrane protein insertase n=1 Tax=uncultured Shewanella sp. TaxID=173975 RepID=UPI002636613E|nr:membrane protein insertase YidC [uncultured Shewanella sp.]